MRIPAINWLAAVGLVLFVIGLIWATVAHTFWGVDSAALGGWMYWILITMIWRLQDGNRA